MLKQKGFALGLIWCLIGSMWPWESVLAQVRDGRSEYDEIISVLVEDRLYDDRALRRVIDRYTGDVAETTGAQVVLTPVPRSAQPRDIQAGLKQLYEQGLGDRRSGLVGVALVGDVPLPVVQKREGLWPSVFPYTDFVEPTYQWDSSQERFVYQSAQNMKPEIWHGLIRSHYEDFELRREQLIAFFDKNHRFHNGQETFSKQMFLADFSRQNQVIDGEDVFDYRQWLKYAEQRQYYHWTKEFLRQIEAEKNDRNSGGLIFDEADQIALQELLQGTETTVEQYIQEVQNDDYADLPDILSKFTIDKYLRSYADIYEQWLAQNYARVAQSGRWSKETIDTTVSLVHKKDQVSLYKIKAFNQLLQNRLIQALGNSQVPEHILSNDVPERCSNLLGSETSVSEPFSKKRQFGRPAMEYVTRGSGDDEETVLVRNPLNPLEPKIATEPRGAAGCAMFLPSRGEFDDDREYYSGNPSVVVHDAPSRELLSTQLMAEVPTMDLAVDEVRKYSFYDVDRNFHVRDLFDLHDLRDVLDELDKDSLKAVIEVWVRKEIDWLNAQGVQASLKQGLRDPQLVTDDFLASLWQVYSPDELYEALRWIESDLDTKNQQALTMAFAETEACRDFWHDPSFNGYEYAQIVAGGDGRYGMEASFAPEDIPLDPELLAAKKSFDGFLYEPDFFDPETDATDQRLQKLLREEAKSQSQLLDRCRDKYNGAEPQTTTCYAQTLIEAPVTRLDLGADLHQTHPKSTPRLLPGGNNDDRPVKIELSSNNQVYNQNVREALEFTITLRDQDDQIRDRDYETEVELVVLDRKVLDHFAIYPGDKQVVTAGEAHFFLVPKVEQPVLNAGAKVVGRLSQAKRVRSNFLELSSSELRLDYRLSDVRVIAGSGQLITGEVRVIDKNGEISNVLNGTVLDFETRLGQIRPESDKLFEIQNGRLRFVYTAGEVAGESGLVVRSASTLVNELALPIEILPDVPAGILVEGDSDYLVWGGGAQNLKMKVVDRYGNLLPKVQHEWRITAENLTIKDQNKLDDNTRYQGIQHRTSEGELGLDITPQKPAMTSLFKVESNLFPNKTFEKIFVVIEKPQLSVKLNKTESVAGQSEEVTVSIEARKADGGLLSGVYPLELQTLPRPFMHPDRDLQLQDGRAVFRFDPGVQAGEYELLFSSPGFESTRVLYDLRAGDPAKVDLVPLPESERLTEKTALEMQVFVFDAYENLVTKDISPVTVRATNQTQGRLKDPSVIVPIEKGQGTVRFETTNSTGPLHLVATHGTALGDTEQLYLRRYLDHAFFAGVTSQALITSLYGFDGGNHGHKDNLATRWLHQGRTQVVGTTLNPVDTTRRVGGFGLDGLLTNGLVARLSPKDDFEVIFNNQKDEFLNLSLQRDFFGFEIQAEQMPVSFWPLSGNDLVLAVKDQNLYLNDKVLLEILPKGGVEIRQAGTELKSTKAWNRFEVWFYDRLLGQLVWRTDDLELLSDDLRVKSRANRAGIVLSLSKSFYGLESGFVGRSTTDPKGYFILDQRSVESAKNTLQSLGRNENKALESAEFGWDVGFKPGLLLAGKNTAGASYAFGASDNGVVYGDPTIRLPEDNLRLPVSGFDSSFGTIVDELESVIPRGLHSLDVDMDGDLDLLIQTRNTLSWYENIDPLMGSFMDRGLLIDFGEVIEAVKIWPHKTNEVGPADILVQKTSGSVERYHLVDDTWQGERLLLGLLEPVSVYPARLNDDAWTDLIFTTTDNQLMAVYGSENNFGNPVLVADFSPIYYGKKEHWKSDLDYSVGENLSQMKVYTKDTDHPLVDLKYKILPTESLSELTDLAALQVETQITPRSGDRSRVLTKDRLQQVFRFRSDRSLGEVYILIPEDQRYPLQLESMKCRGCSKDDGLWQSVEGDWFMKISGFKKDQNYEVVLDRMVAELPEIVIEVGEFDMVPDGLSDVRVPWLTSDDIVVYEFLSSEKKSQILIGKQKPYGVPNIKSLEVSDGQFVYPKVDLIESKFEADFALSADMDLDGIPDFYDDQPTEADLTDAEILARNLDPKACQVIHDELLADKNLIQGCHEKAACSDTKDSEVRGLPGLVQNENNYGASRVDPGKPIVNRRTLRVYKGASNRGDKFVSVCRGLKKPAMKALPNDLNNCTLASSPIPRPIASCTDSGAGGLVFGDSSLQNNSDILQASLFGSQSNNLPITPGFKALLGLEPSSQIRVEPEAALNGVVALFDDGYQIGSETNLAQKLQRSDLRSLIKDNVSGVLSLHSTLMETAPNLQGYFGQLGGGHLSSQIADGFNDIQSQFEAVGNKIQAPEIPKSNQVDFGSSTASVHQAMAQNESHFKRNLAGHMAGQAQRLLGNIDYPSSSTSAKSEMNLDPGSFLSPQRAITESLVTQGFTNPNTMQPQPIDRGLLMTRPVTAFVEEGSQNLVRDKAILPWRLTANLLAQDDFVPGAGVAAQLAGEKALLLQKRQALPFGPGQAVADQYERQAQAILSAGEQQVEDLAKLAAANAVVTKFLNATTAQNQRNIDQWRTAEAIQNMQAAAWDKVSNQFQEKFAQKYARCEVGQGAMTGWAQDQYTQGTSLPIMQPQISPSLSLDQTTQSLGQSQLLLSPDFYTIDANISQNGARGTGNRRINYGSSLQSSSLSTDSLYEAPLDVLTSSVLQNSQPTVLALPNRSTVIPSPEPLQNFGPLLGQLLQISQKAQSLERLVGKRWISNQTKRPEIEQRPGAEALSGPSQIKNNGDAASNPQLVSQTLSLKQGQIRKSIEPSVDILGYNTGLMDVGMKTFLSEIRQLDNLGQDLVFYDDYDLLLADLRRDIVGIQPTDRMALSSKKQLLARLDQLKSVSSSTLPQRQTITRQLAEQTKMIDQSLTTAKNTLNRLYTLYNESPRLFTQNTEVKALSQINKDIYRATRKIEETLNWPKARDLQGALIQSADFAVNESLVQDLKHKAYQEVWNTAPGQRPAGIYVTGSGNVTESISRYNFLRSPQTVRLDVDGDGIDEIFYTTEDGLFLKRKIEKKLVFKPLPVIRLSWSEFNPNQS